MALWRRRSDKDLTLRLRPYSKADLSALHALDQVCFDPDIAYSRAELEAFLEHPSGFAIVACRGAQIVGFAIVRSVRRVCSAQSGQSVPPAQPIQIADSTHRVEAAAGVQPGVDGNQAALHILTIDVSPEARRQGIGVLLMDWIILKAAILRARAIVLEVAVTNETAQKFYQRFGFAVLGTIPGYYNGTTDALSLERLTHYEE